MSLSRILIGILKNNEETKDHAKNPQLTTRYYKERHDKVVDTVVQGINTKLSSWKVVHVDRQRGEIMAEKNRILGKSDIVITVYRISPLSSAIDLVVSKRGMFGDLGSSYFIILEFFRELHKVLQPEKK